MTDATISLRIQVVMMVDLHDDWNLQGSYLRTRPANARRD